MQINGLPLHVLVVHAAVVFGPLAAALAIAYAVLPGWRDRLRWVTLATVLVATGAIWLAYFSGEDFLESDRFGFLKDNPELAGRIEDHQELGTVLPWVATGFAAVTVLATALHARTGAVRMVLSGLVVVGAVATLVYTILTGDAGAQAVWGS